MKELRPPPPPPPDAESESGPPPRLSDSIALGTPPPEAAGGPADVPLAPGDRLILEAPLGEGGMGKVYRARDQRLMRTVAVKLLRAGGFALEQRFLHEAQAQARVEHENVCKVYEVGRFDGGPFSGEPFICMQYIAGETLRTAGPRLSLAEKVEVLRKAALGVHAAHRQGLIHRDLKPDNVLIERGEDGAVKPYVTDFGLARDLLAPGGTRSGEVLGTPEYMAPEQARGELGLVDARTDVYGLGALLFELLAGRPPFLSGPLLEVLGRVAHGDLPDLAQLAPDAPPELCAVAMRCLALDPARRYATARELAEELGRWQRGEQVQARPQPKALRLWTRLRRSTALTGALVALGLLGGGDLLRARFFAPGKALSLAVADFDNQTGEAGLDGLSGMLITSLEQSRRLSVLTRSRMLDVVREIGIADPARIDEQLGREIARRAGAQALLLGAVHKRGARYAVALRILDSSSGKGLLALDDESDLAGVPQLIDRLSERARRGLSEQESEVRKSQARMEVAATGSLTAYNHYFRGTELLDKLKFAAARQEFTLALADDPAFALAWYQLAHAQYWLHDAVGAKATLLHALPMASRLPERERFLIEGMRAWLWGEHDKAFAAYTACRARFPQEKECIFEAGDLLYHSGQPEKAIRWFEDALALDGTMERALSHLARAYQLRGDGDKLLALAQQYVARVGNDEAWGLLGRAWAVRGDLSRAREVFQGTADRLPQSTVPLLDLAQLQLFEGDRRKAEQTLQPLLAPSRPAGERARGLVMLAEAQLDQGRVRESLASLERAEQAAKEAGDESAQAYAICWQALVHIQLLRDVPGARALVKRALLQGLPEAAFRWTHTQTGDFDEDLRLLHALGEPLADAEVAAFRARAEGFYADSALQFGELARRSPSRELWQFMLADVQEKQGRFAAAIEQLGELLTAYPEVDGRSFGMYAISAHAGLSMSRCAAALGDKARALQLVDRFLAQWKDADADLPDLAEAKALRMRLTSPG